jgi:spore maturation protein CgeB
MKLAFYGSSLLSAHRNGAATYYRGILAALGRQGFAITFHEPDIRDRREHRDIGPPAWCRVAVYPATDDGMKAAATEAAEADIVIKASGVGYADEALLTAAFAAARPDALRIWWDLDAPATIAEIGDDETHPLRIALPDLDLVLSSGGGNPVEEGFRHLGAKACETVYAALDPATHHPVAADPRFSCDLGFLGNRMADREERIETYLLEPADRLGARKFLVAGAGWEDKPCPPSLTKLGHLGTDLHNAFNASARAVLNVNRAAAAATGYCPSPRLFEAAGAGACLITDAWRGIEMFLTPGKEILVARDADDVVEALDALTPERAREIGEQALARLLADHTYARRAEALAGILGAAFRKKAGMRAA